MNIELTSFDLDDLRISRRPLPLDTVPDQPLARDEDTRYLETFDTLPDAASLTGRLFRLVEGRLGQALASAPEPVMDRLALDGKRIVIYHENWSRFQGYPDLEQIPRLKRIADACHQRGMLFLIYFNQSVSDASPEWPLMRDDLLVLPEGLHYHRDDVVQDCYGGCVNGPYGDLLLAGIEKLADETGIDGVYMDGTTVPWHCANPSHPGCGEYRGDGTYLHHQPLRATRQFMKRLRSIFASRGQNIFLDAHTGGCINIATQSFCDGYYDGETLHRFKPGFRLAPDTLLTGYMGKQFGFRGEFLPHRHSMDQALALGLVHDTMTRGQPAEVDLALADYEDDATRFVPYWEDSGLFSVKPEQVLGSVYLKPDRAMLVLGSQTEDSSNCDVDLAPLLENLPPGVEARDAMSGEPLELNAGRLSLSLPGRGWRMVELRPR